VQKKKIDDEIRLRMVTHLSVAVASTPEGAQAVDWLLHVLDVRVRRAAFVEVPVAAGEDVKGVTYELAG
jgi:hypothetical protein